MNLLNETINKLEEYGKYLDDVVFIGCESFGITKEQFISLANKEYDDGFGSQEVAQDLIVRGNDFWLERHEYDGSEWWEFKTLPRIPDKVRHIDLLFCDGWKCLTEINKHGNNDD